MGLVNFVPRNFIGAYGVQEHTFTLPRVPNTLVQSFFRTYHFNFNLYKHPPQHFINQDLFLIFLYLGAIHSLVVYFHKGKKIILGLARFISFNEQNL